MSRSSFRALAAATAAALTLAIVIVPASAQAATGFVPRVVVAMGDSITRAAVADGTRNDNVRYNWSTGSSSSTQSHVTRLAQLNGWTPTAWNVAVGGTTSDDLVRQANQVVSRGADYVTILSGGNEVCRSESLDALPAPETVAANFAAALEIINAGRPDARIFVASIPNMRKLHAAGVQTITAPIVWSALGVCPLAMSDPLNFSADAEHRRATVESYIRTLNTVIADVCAKASLCFSDGGAVFDMPVKIANVSTLDYFHPSVQGQAELAEATWSKAVEAGVFDTVKTPVPPEPQPTVTKVVDDTSTAISWAGEWASTRSSLDRGGSVTYLKSMASSFSLTFTGTKVSLVVRKTPSAGISEISIDGVVVGTVNSYAPTVEYDQTVFASRALASGTHTITVSPTMELPTGSSGRNLVVDALVIETVEK